MILFEWNEQDQRDYENWMLNIKQQINENVSNKSSVWSFNFKSGEATNKDRFHWEDIKGPCQRLSTNMRSTISTLPTMGEEELTEDIPSISDLDLRISLELAKSPIVLLPHKSFSQNSKIRKVYDGSEENCVVCFGELEKGGEERVKECGHKVHLRCWEKDVSGCFGCGEFRGK